MAVTEAIVVLPSGAFGRIGDRGLRSWLSKGEIAFNTPTSGPLESVVADLNAPLPESSGFSAWRYWGQTGRRPDGWIAAADPVCLRPRMRDIVVEVMPADVIPRADLEALSQSLASAFDDSGIRFEFVDSMGYLFSDMPLLTAVTATENMHGQVPAMRRSSGGDDRYQRINTEIQMVLHEHPVNQRRQANGLSPINALWLWGGGTLEEPKPRSLPALFGDDPLFRGYWLAHDVRPDAWPGDLEACSAAGPGSFVAVPPETAERSPDPWLFELRTLLAGGRIRRLTLYFRDGLCAKLTARDRFRFWKPVAGELQERETGD